MNSSPRHRQPRRLLLSLGRDCPFRCTYCFASFKDYTPGPTVQDLLRNHHLADGYDVLYPACDTDLFARHGAMEMLRALLPLNKHISVSTKAHLATATIDDLAAIAQSFRTRDKLLKVSISISAPDDSALIELGCAPAHQRFQQLVALKAAGIPTSLNVKPILSQVSMDSYQALISLAADHDISILLGEEYRPLSERANSPVRTVGWLPIPHTWEVHGTERYLHLFDYATKLGAQVFTTDTQVLARIAKQLHFQFP